MTAAAILSPTWRTGLPPEKVPVLVVIPSDRGPSGPYIGWVKMMSWGPMWVVPACAGRPDHQPFPIVWADVGATFDAAHAAAHAALRGA